MGMFLHSSTFHHDEEMGLSCRVMDDMVMDGGGSEEQCMLLLLGHTVLGSFCLIHPYAHSPLSQ